MPRRSTLFLCFWASATALSSIGCRLQHDPSKMVTIEISGIPDGKESERVLERIDEAQKQSKKWTDGSSNVMNWNGTGQQMTVEMAPVSDVDAFVKKLDFGRVTAVEGRKIKVVFPPSAVGAVGGIHVATEQSRPAPLTIIP
jgi:hypothetical protein